MATRGLEEAVGERPRLVDAADERAGFAQLGKYEGEIQHAAPAGDALEGLVQERDGLRLRVMSHHWRLSFATLFPHIESRIPHRDHPIAHSPHLQTAADHCLAGVET